MQLKVNYLSYLLASGVFVCMYWEQHTSPTQETLGNAEPGNSQTV